FSVQARDGEAYARAGDFSINAQGQLVTRQGLPVLSEDGAPVEIPERGALAFSGDGQITVLGAGDRPNDLQALGRLKLVNPPAADMRRGDDGLFRMAQGHAAPADAPVRLVASISEKSKVRPR